MMWQNIDFIVLILLRSLHKFDDFSTRKQFEKWPQKALETKNELNILYIFASFGSKKF